MNDSYDLDGHNDTYDDNYELNVNQNKKFNDVWDEIINAEKYLHQKKLWKKKD
jgi:hypothetical protein